MTDAEKLQAYERVLRAIIDECALEPNNPFAEMIAKLAADALAVR